MATAGTSWQQEETAGNSCHQVGNPHRLLQLLLATWQPGAQAVVPMEYANHEASILKDALLPMKDEDWWAYKFELIGGWMPFLDPFLDAIQNGTLP